MDDDHRPLSIAAITVACLMFVVTMVFNGLAGASPDGLALFLNSTGGVSAFYYTDITPAGWTFSIWGVIYVWQALFLVYALTTLCRTTTYGYVYVSPGHQPSSIYWLYSFNLLCNISWLLLWDRFIPEWALLFILLLPITLIMCLCVSHYQLYRCAPILMREGMHREVWAARLITQNGLAFYATWVWIASFINLDVVLIYVGGMDVSIAGTICLACLLTDVIIYFFLDTFILDKYLRYTFSPYVVLIVGVTGSLVQNWALTSNNAVLSAVLLALICLATVLKVVVFLVRRKVSPIYPPEDEVTMFLEESGKKDYGTVRYEPIEDP